MSDEEYFGAVAKEIAAGQINENLLAKAKFLVEGDKKRAERKYIELRVQQLKADKTRKYVSSTKVAARVIAPALKTFARDLIKAILFGLLVLGVVAAIVEVFRQ